MTESSYATFVERESTHAVYRKHVQIRFRAATNPDEQAQLISTALALANIARSFDPAFDYRIEADLKHRLLIEFELNFPERFGSAVDEWITEEAKIRPEVLELVLPAGS